MHYHLYDMIIITSLKKTTKIYVTVSDIYTFLLILHEKESLMNVLMFRIWLFLINELYLLTLLIYILLFLISFKHPFPLMYLLIAFLNSSFHTIRLLISCLPFQFFVLITISEQNQLHMYWFEFVKCKTVL